MIKVESEMLNVGKENERERKSVKMKWKKTRVNQIERDDEKATNKHEGNEKDKLERK